MGGGGGGGLLVRQWGWVVSIVVSVKIVWFIKEWFSVSGCIVLRLILRCAIIVKSKLSDVYRRILYRWWTEREGFILRRQMLLWVLKWLGRIRRGRLRALWCRRGRRWRELRRVQMSAIGDTSMIRWVLSSIVARASGEGLRVRLRLGLRGKRVDEVGVWRYFLDVTGTSVWMWGIWGRGGKRRRNRGMEGRGIRIGI